MAKRKKPEFRRPTKATNHAVTVEMLKERTEYNAKLGYTKPKWIGFCEELLAEGYKLDLYEARRTVYKYITVKNWYGKPFKVRFSNHKPIKFREIQGDCDFFVGHTHTGITTTTDALRAVSEFFAAQPIPKPSQKETA